MDASNDTPLAAGTLLAGKYEIRRRLGSGGMGAVYEARHARMNKRVAVKVIHPQFAKNAEAVGRFLREAEAAARIRHPNVIDVVDIDERHDPPFMVLEYLEGRSLATVLERDQKLSVGATAALMLPVLNAVAAAHEAGIVHRDLKPENIFIARAGDGSIRPVVLDFGVAKIEASAIQGLTQTNAMVGTVVYMSPEQARDSKRVDAKSDQYTLGVILYECVTGVRPCDGDTLYNVLSAIVEAKYIPLRERAPSVAAAFEAIVTRAMSLDPSQRFSSVKAMSDALAPLAEGQKFSFSRDSWATEFAFGSTMSADGTSESAVVRAVEAVVGAKPGAISADDHAARVSTPAPLSGPTLAEPIAAAVPRTQEPTPKRAAPSTLGGSSIELPSPVSREDTIVSGQRKDSGHKGLIAVVLASAVALISGVAVMQRSSASSSAATPPHASAQPSVAPSPTVTRVAETAVRPAETSDRDSGVAANSLIEPAVTAQASPAVTANSQTAPSSSRPGRRPPSSVVSTTTAHSNQPAATPSNTPTTTNERPANSAANPHQTNTSTQTPTEGPRQVGGGFVL
ncbi:MAG: protein kinase [Polyangiales bacterium]